jgi:dihydrofolate reductase
VLSSQFSAGPLASSKGHHERREHRTRQGRRQQVDVAGRLHRRSRRRDGLDLRLHGAGRAPFSGPTFVLTHRPPDPPDPDVTYLTGDITEAVTTALDAAAGKDLEILGADVAGQCLREGLVDEIRVYVLPLLLGDGIRFCAPGLPRIDLEPIGSTEAGAVTILRFRVRK